MYIIVLRIRPANALLCGIIGKYAEEADDNYLGATNYPVSGMVKSGVKAHRRGLIPLGSSSPRAGLVNQ